MYSVLLVLFSAESELVEEVITEETRIDHVAQLNMMETYSGQIPTATILSTGNAFDSSDKNEPNASQSTGIVEDFEQNQPLKSKESKTVKVIDLMTSDTDEEGSTSRVGEMLPPDEIQKSLLNQSAAVPELASQEQCDTSESVTMSVVLNTKALKRKLAEENKADFIAKKLSKTSYLTSTLKKGTRIVQTVVKVPSKNVNENAAVLASGSSKEKMEVSRNTKPYQPMGKFSVEIGKTGSLAGTKTNRHQTVSSETGAITSGQIYHSTGKIRTDSSIKSGKNRVIMKEANIHGKPNVKVIYFQDFSKSSSAASAQRNFPETGVEVERRATEKSIESTNSPVPLEHHDGVTVSGVDSRVSHSDTLNSSNGDGITTENSLKQSVEVVEYEDQPKLQNSSNSTETSSIVIKERNIPTEHIVNHLCEVVQYKPQPKPQTCVARNQYTSVRVPKSGKFGRIDRKVGAPSRELKETTISSVISQIEKLHSGAVMNIGRSDGRQAGTQHANAGKKSLDLHQLEIKNILFAMTILNIKFFNTY